jgi:hypothetical protein
VSGSGLHEHEFLRARWRRFGDRQQLADPEAVDLGLGGLGGHVPNLSVRFPVLPADPEATVISFDDAFWQWWGVATNPFKRPAGRLGLTIELQQIKTCLRRP